MELKITIPDGELTQFEQAWADLGLKLPWQEAWAVSPTGQGTKSLLGVAWLFYPKRLDSVVAFYAYPAGPEPLCYGSAGQWFERADGPAEALKGATAVIRMSPDSERYAWGQVWGAPSPAWQESLDSALRAYGISPGDAELGGGTMAGGIRGGRDPVWGSPSPAWHKNLDLAVEDGSLCVTIRHLDCQAPAAGQDADCLFLAERAIPGATPAAKFWIDQRTRSFYRGSVEHTLMMR